jgi:hypothetical protein
VQVSNVWRAGAPQTELDEPGLIAAVDQTATAGVKYAFIDIEAWPLLHVAPSIRDASITKLVRATEVVRRHRPDLQFGVYGSPPAVTYWPLVASDHAGYGEWRDANRALRRVAERVDFILPSLYTFYSDRTDWLKYAGATLDEARSYGKPVYPFLWFEYHNSNRLLGGQELDPAAWEEELRFCRDLADGVVLWGGSGEAWSENAHWWRSALRVLRPG